MKLFSRNKKATNQIFSFEYYDNYIQTHFIGDRPGLSNLGKIKFESLFKINLDSPTLLDIEKLREELKGIFEFIQSGAQPQYKRLLWYKLNVIDQAINDYVGIGFLNLEGDWLKFILEYLNQDRADQGGDTIFAIFDIKFKSAVCFTLSQDESELHIEKYER